MKTIALKELRSRAKQLGITPESAGCPVEELIARARENEDPLAYLGLYVPEPAAAGDESPPAADPPPDVDAESPPPPDVEAIVEVTLRVPLLDGDPPGHCGRHVDAQLNADQAWTLKQLRIALDKTDARLANGKHVDGRADVIRWLMEQIGR